MGLSRRQFIRRVSAGGGTGAAYSAMLALGLIGPPLAYAGPPALPAALGRGRHVVILGAGIAGLVTAYELERAGFRVTVLEARARVGGRNWSIRGGDRIELIGEEAQTAALSEGLYFNAGPARIPSHHQGLLSYARALNVPLEVEVNSSRSALLPSPDGRPPIQQRQAVNDTRGYVSELLARALNKGALDEALNAEDRQRLVDFLKAYGDLGPDHAYRGSERSGYVVEPGAADKVGRGRDPIPLRELLRNDQLASIVFEDNILMQATMFQPVGGMDRIPHALAGAIRSPIVRGAAVEQIRGRDDGVHISYLDRRTRVRHAIEADYAVVTIPLPVLAGLDTNFTSPVKAAIAGAVYDHANKVAFEAPRFWERQQIYGGISFTGGENSLVWYPSAGLHTERGTLVAAYNNGKTAEAFARKPLQGQIAAARAAVEAIHPGQGASLSRPIVVNWRKVPFNLGPWLHWNAEGGEPSINDPAAYALLNQPHGRIYFSGAHLSQMPTWQEGAVLAAHRTVAELGGRVAAAATTDDPKGRAA